MTDLRTEVRTAISNAYYEARNHGQTMETAADDAVRAVMGILAGRCDLCGHALHGDSECGEAVGYDHLNGDHECGCPGVPDPERVWDECAEEAHALGWLHDDARTDVLARNPYRVE